MSSSEAVEFRDEERTCFRCNEPYTCQVAYVGSTRLPGAPALCPGCAAAEAREEGVRWDPIPGPSVDEALEAAGVNVRKHGRCTLDGFDPAASPKAVEAAREFVAEAKAAGRHDPVRGLYLCGPTGTGKTHLAVAVMRELAGSRLGTLLFDRAARLVTEIQDTYGTGGTGAVLGKREAAGLWVLDDLGTEKATPDALRILFDLLNAREGHPTVITSNYAPAELEARWRDSDEWRRLSSRLAGQNFRAVRVDGSDRRFAA